MSSKARYSSRQYGLCSMLEILVRDTLFISNFCRLLPLPLPAASVLTMQPFPAAYFLIMQLLSVSTSCIYAVEFPFLFQTTAHTFGDPFQLIEDVNAFR